jgi:hypothetical protein
MASQETLTKTLFSFGSLVFSRSGLTNKLVVVSFTAIIILSIIYGFLFYELNPVQNELSKYTNLVEITEVRVSDGNPHIGLFMIAEAKDTIENVGVNDVEGMVLTIKHSMHNDTGIYNLDVLNSGEKKVKL